MERRSRPGTIAYWSLVVFLLAFGFLSLFSIGYPLMVLGIVLAVLEPYRGRRGVLAAGIASVFGFVVGYVLIAPIGCSGTTTPSTNGSLPVEGETICRSVLGWNYSGDGANDPSLFPALIVGVLCAILVGFVAYRLATWSSRDAGRSSPSRSG